MSLSHKRPRSQSLDDKSSGREGKITRWAWIRGARARKEKNASSTTISRQLLGRNPWLAADENEEKSKLKPGPKGKPGAPAVGQRETNEESNDEGFAARVTLRDTDKSQKKIPIDDVVGEIILIEDVYPEREVWRQATGKPWRPDTK